ncbi:hypothetical protein GCM10027039_29070 [Terrabacter koreensis]
MPAQALDATATAIVMRSRDSGAHHKTQFHPSTEVPTKKILSEMVRPTGSKSATAATNTEAPMPTSSPWLRAAMTSAPEATAPPADKARRPPGRLVQLSSTLARLVRTFIAAPPC